MYKYLAFFVVLAGCVYNTKPHTCYYVNEGQRGILNSDYVCIADVDKDDLYKIDYTIDESLLEYIGTNVDMCKFEAQENDSDEYFVYADKKIDLKTNKVYFCQPGTIQIYAEKRQKQLEIERQKQREQELKEIKEWEKETGCVREKSIFVDGDKYETTQQLKEGLTVIHRIDYSGKYDDLPLSMFIIQNQIDKHFVDNERWFGGWFQDTGIDRKFINVNDKLSRIRKYKRCIDKKTLQEFKKLGIQ